MYLGKVDVDFSFLNVKDYTWASRDGNGLEIVYWNIFLDDFVPNV